MKQKIKYKEVWLPGHPRANKNGCVPEHILVVERITGISVTREMEVHHVNGNGTDNRPENLVLCPDKAYHQLLHKRERALTACGNPSWRKCIRCSSWDDPKNLHVYKSGAVHPACATAHAAFYRKTEEKKK